MEIVDGAKTGVALATLDENGPNGRRFVSFDSPFFVKFAMPRPWPSVWVL